MNKSLLGIGAILLVVGIGLSLYSVTVTASVRNPAYCGSYGCGPAFYTASATGYPYFIIGIIVIFISIISMIVGAVIDRDSSSGYYQRSKFGSGSLEEMAECRFCGELWKKSSILAHEERCSENPTRMTR